MVCSLWQRQDTLQLWQIKLAMSVCSVASTQCADLLDMGYLDSLVLRVIQQIALASKKKYDEKGTPRPAHTCTHHQTDPALTHRRLHAPGTTTCAPSHAPATLIKLVCVSCSSSQEFLLVILRLALLYDADRLLGGIFFSIG